MRILITGDSITEGELGYDYVEDLRRRLPDSEIVNLGLGGDTISGIKKRTLNHLKRNNIYDVIVVAAGHNDIILPTFQNLTRVHKFIVQQLKKRGSIPSSSKKEFMDTYEKFIDEILKINKGKIIVTTLSCLNENLTSKTNETREEYNEIIKEMAKRKKIHIADVGYEFNEQLKERKCKDFFMDNLLNTFIFDKRKCKENIYVDDLSKKRGLFITIDGVHINSLGGKIYSDTIFDKITNI